MSQVLGVLIPGGIVRTDFVPSDQSGTKFTLALTGKFFLCSCELFANLLVLTVITYLIPGITGVEIASVSELIFFLLPGVTLPQDHGAMLFWQISSSSQNPNSKTEGRSL